MREVSFQHGGSKKTAAASTLTSRKANRRRRRLSRERRRRPRTQTSNATAATASVTTAADNCAARRSLKMSREREEEEKEGSLINLGPRTRLPQRFPLLSSSISFPGREGQTDNTTRSPERRRVSSSLSRREIAWATLSKFDDDGDDGGTGDDTSSQLCRR